MLTVTINPKVDAYINRLSKWQEESKLLRDIVLETGLREELKWGVPCYMYNDSNVIIIHGFKEYCAVLFVKGALLKDSEGILIRQTENVQSGRQIRFKKTEDIDMLRDTIKKYIFEAIEIEKAGLKVPMRNVSDYNIPDEFQLRLDQMPELKASFESLTPGRQRAYLLYFSAPKQSKTRESRVEKCIEKILNGKGLDD